jgi:WD40 repeat protein
VGKFERVVLVDGVNPRVGLLRAGKHWQFRDISAALPLPQETAVPLEQLVAKRRELPLWAEDAESLQQRGIVAEGAAGPISEEESGQVESDRTPAERSTVTIEGACVDNLNEGEDFEIEDRYRTILGPRGRHLLVLTESMTCILPTTADGRVQRLPVDDVVDAVFRSDGRFVVLLEKDGTSSIWPVQSNAPQRLPTAQNIVHTWFAPLEDDAPKAPPVLYGLDRNSTLHRWRMQIGPVREHLPAVENVVGITPDSLWAVVNDAMGARLQSLSGDDKVLALDNFENRQPLQFSADSRLIAQVHRRGGVWVWMAPDAESVQLPDSDGVTRLAMAGQLVAGLSAERLRVWRVDGPSAEAVGSLPVNPDSRVRFTPDGRYLLLDSKSANRPSLTRLTVSNLQSRYHFKVPDGTQTLGLPRISPDGRFVVADAAVDGQVDRLLAWHIESEDGEPRVLRGQNALDGYQINGWSFASRLQKGKADRVHVLIRSNVGAIERRALGDDGVDGSLLGHSRLVEDLVYHPSGRLLTRDQNDEVRLWLARSQTGATGFLTGQFTTQVLDDGTAQIENAVFGPRGEWLVTQTRYGRLWAWPLAWPSLMRLLRDRTDVCLTADERVRYLGGKWNHAQAEAAGCPPPPLR